MILYGIINYPQCHLSLLSLSVPSLLLPTLVSMTCFSHFLLHNTCVLLLPSNARASHHSPSLLFCHLRLLQVIYSDLKIRSWYPQITHEVLVILDLGCLIKYNIFLFHPFTCKFCYFFFFFTAGQNFIVCNTAFSFLILQLENTQVVSISSYCKQNSSEHD